MAGLMPICPIKTWNYGETASKGRSLGLACSRGPGQLTGRELTGKGNTVKRQFLRLVAATAIASAGLMAFGAPAQAHQISGFNTGFFTGNQFSFVYQQPISVCGNAIAVFGFASASCHGGAYAINR